MLFVSGSSEKPNLVVSEGERGNPLVRRDEVCVQGRVERTGHSGRRHAPKNSEEQTHVRNLEGKGTPVTGPGEPGQNGIQNRPRPKASGRKYVKRTP
jgi:hypothetical protein